MELLPVPSKISIKELEAVVSEYQKMATDAERDGNIVAAESARFIAEDLASCAKYTSDYYNRNDNNDEASDENSQGNRR